MAKPIITAIDIGSSKIKGIVVQENETTPEKYQILSYWSLPSFGVRRGTVIDPDKVCEVLCKLKERLERESRRKIKSVLVNIGGHHIFTKLTNGAIAISRADQKVSQEDIERVLDEAKAVNLPLNKEVLEIYPREYIIDGEGGIKDPLGLRGIKLEVEALATCVFSPYLKNLVDAVLGAGLEIIDIIPSPLASAQAVLTPQQKELGVVLVDIGAGNTGIAVFEEGSLMHLAIFPVGSSHISNDIAIALKTEIDIAEEIKKKFGNLIFKNTNRKEKIKLESGEMFVFSTKDFTKAAKARIAEIFDLVKKELKKISKSGNLPAGVVLTGGGAKIPNIVDYVKKDLSLPTRVSVPKNFIGPDIDETFSTVCGLALIGLQEAEEEKSIFDSKPVKKLKKFFKIFIP
ncbi:cell division protein FtsA [bacterium]|nr:cell division protein FtsA [bacterium]